MLTSPQDHKAAFAAGEDLARDDVARSLASLPMPLIESRVGGIVRAYRKLLCGFGLERAIAAMLRAEAELADPSAEPSAERLAEPPGTGWVAAEPSAPRIRPLVVPRGANIVSVLGVARQAQAARVLFRAAFDTVEIAALIGRPESEIVELLHARNPVEVVAHGAAEGLGNES